MVIPYRFADHNPMILHLLSNSTHHFKLILKEIVRNFTNKIIVVLVEFLGLKAIANKSKRISITI